MKKMKFRVGDIQPSPFRTLDRYPLRSDKVEELRESLREAGGFWQNIVARIREDGFPEIAHGHHRLEALRREYGPDSKVSLNVGEFDDETFLQMMIRENRETWGSSASVEQENVRAVVEAYASGRIELPQRGGGHSQHRYAPSFRIGETSGADLRSPYSVGTLADFVKLDRTKVEDTLHALELIEKDVLSESQYEGLKSNYARVITTEIRKVTHTLEDRASRYEADAKEALDSADDEESRTRAKDLHTFALQQAQRTREHAAADVKFFVDVIRKRLLEGTWSARQVPGQVKKYFGLQTRARRDPETKKKGTTGTEVETDPVVQMFLDELRDFHINLIEIRRELTKFPVEALDFAELQFKTLQNELEKTDLKFAQVLERSRRKGRGGLLEYIR